MFNNYEQILDLQHNHTRQALDYKKQLTYLENQFDIDRDKQMGVIKK